MVNGAPQSGTKFLQQLLDQHPVSVVTATESESLPWVIDDCAHGGMERPGGLEWLVEHLRPKEYFAEQELAAFPPVDFNPWRSRLRGPDVANVLRAFLECEVGTALPGADLGHKLPGSIRHLERIMVELDDARVVSIARDPRAQCGLLCRTFGKLQAHSAVAWSKVLGEQPLEVWVKDLHGHGASSHRRTLRLCRALPGQLGEVGLRVGILTARMRSQRHLLHLGRSIEAA